MDNLFQLTIQSKQKEKKKRREEEEEKKERLETDCECVLKSEWDFVYV